jgi:diadenosine tetraphosphate (Ap4A) HIT family hydrolase
MSDVVECALCATDGGSLLWRGKHVRVVQVDDPDYPGYCRVIWNACVREMSDLDGPGRTHLLEVVHVVERSLRDMLDPDKINLASLGNQVPHLHWHVIPRWSDDRHFPDPIWAVPRRPAFAHGLSAGRDAAWAARLAGARALGQVLPPALNAAFPW